MIQRDAVVEKPQGAGGVGIVAVVAGAVREEEELLDAPDGRHAGEPQAGRVHHAVAREVLQPGRRDRHRLHLRRAGAAGGRRRPRPAAAGRGGSCWIV